MSARTPLLVGLVLVLGTASLTWFVLTTAEGRYDDANTYYLFADFNDASGIRWKTRVQINGIDVGKIDDVRHVRTKRGDLVARVKLRILDEYTLYENAAIEKSAESLLGDYRLDIYPGTPDYPPLEEGDVIRQVQSVSDMEAIQNELKQVAVNVNEVTESLRKVLAGPEGEGSLKAILDRVETSMGAIETATTALSDAITRNDQVIEEVIRDVGSFSGRLAQMSEPGGDFTVIANNLAELSGRINQMADSVSELVSGDADEWEDGGSLRRTVDNLNQTASRLNDVARKIDEGKGTVGQLINDPSVAETLEDTLEDTSELIGGLSRLQTQIELRSEYAVPFGEAAEPQPGQEGAELKAAIKSTLALRIIPRPDKYYLLEAISDPRGKQDRTIVTRSTDGDTVTVESTETSFNDLKFSAQFAKRYYFLTLRFGIIESTGGLGANLHLIDDRLELRFDAFDFSRRDPYENDDIFPRLRTLALYEFVPHLYLQAGLDDPLNPELRTYFLGGALRFTDDDLKSLLTVAPTP